MGQIMRQIDVGLRRIAALGGDPQCADAGFTNTASCQYILAGSEVKEALTEEIDESELVLIPAQVRGGTPMLMPAHDVLRYRGLPIMDEHGKREFLSIKYMTVGGQKELILPDRDV